MAANAPHAPFHQSMEDRIAFHVLPADGRGCRLWRAAKTKKGYPKVKHNGKMYTVTRVLLARRLGRALLPGMEACHTCDVPSCCTPSHLFEGSRKDNQQDMVRKGRSLRGERHNLAKLTEQDVRAIRRLLAVTPKLSPAERRWGPKKRSRKDIAVMFGVSDATIRLIESGAIWKHI
jgi:hypothetical protein